MNFALKVILSFIVGGGYVSGVVWLSEKLGSRIGAAIAGLPSTILISIIFIAAIDGAQSAKSALSLVPLMFMATLAYSWAFARSVGITKSWLVTVRAITMATLAWGMVVMVIRKAADVDFLTIALIGGLSLVGLHFAFRNLRDKKPINLRMPPYMHLARFVIGGGLVAASVVAARVLDPQWGGMVASFPAMLGAILYFLHKSHGIELVEGFIKHLPISYFSSLIFIIIVHQTITPRNVVVSLTTGLVGAFVYSSVYVFIKQRYSKSLRLHSKP